MMAGNRVPMFAVLLLAASSLLSGCGTTLDASTSCRDFLHAPSQDQDAAVSKVASDLRVGSALTPLGRPNIDYLCANNPEMSLGAAVKSTGSDSSGTPTNQASPTAAGEPATPVTGCAAPPKVPTDERIRTLPDKMTASGKMFIATVTTNCGVITMELDGAKAPQTVASFLSLAKSGYWVDSPCHRLTTEGIFVLQCGDPTGTGSGTPGYGYGVENAPANSTFPPGTLAMARTSDPKSNGGQYFIVYKQTVLPDPTGYSIFGRVTNGMDIVNRIAAAGAAPPDASQNTAPKQPISILTVNVAEKKASQ
jgi:peptidyl-prolyl cis-trans isomerase B (cyclophilin B)